MIKAIIFDYFGVITSDNFWPLTGEDINVPGDSHQLVTDINSGKLSWPAFIDEVARELHQTPQTVLVMYKAKKIDLELLGYIKQLRGQYKTALLTNSSKEYLEPLIASLKLDKFFDEIVISSRLGMIKPDPKIFNYTLNRLEVKADETIFVDDGFFNVEAARQLDIKSVLYKSVAQLRQELKRLTGVTF
jgi:epoxide hydrolase-like predicted phosphatase